MGHDRQIVATALVIQKQGQNVMLMTCELSEAQKAENKAISKIRVEVEHPMGGIKRCQVLVQKFRNRVDHHSDEVTEMACGAIKFIIKMQVLNVLGFEKRVLYNAAKADSSYSMLGMTIPYLIQSLL